MRYLGIKINQSLHDKLRARSLEHGLSLSGYARLLLEQGIVFEAQQESIQLSRRTFDLLHKVGRIILEALILVRCCLKEAMGQECEEEFQSTLKGAFAEAISVMDSFAREEQENCDI